MTSPTGGTYTKNHIYDGHGTLLRVEFDWGADGTVDRTAFDDGNDGTIDHGTPHGSRLTVSPLSQALIKRRT